MKKIFLAVVSVFIVFLSGGCNYSDVEDVVVAAGIALDINDNGEYTIVAETIAEGSTAEASVESKTVFANGKTLYEAMENLKNVSGKPFDFSHCQVIFIGERVAKKGICDVVDMVFHSNTLRLTVMLVTVSGSVGDVFDCEIPLYNIVSYGVFDMLKQDKAGSAVFPSSQAYVCLNTLEYKGRELIIPSVSVSDGECAFSGLTVFEKDKAVGNVSLETARRYLLLMGKLSGGDMTVEVDGNNVSFEITDASSRRYIGDAVNDFRAEIKIRVAARQLPDGVDLSVSEDRERLQTDIENAVAAEIVKTFEEIRDRFGSDVFAFGDIVYHERPGEWKSVSADWKKFFSESTLTVGCDCVIEDAGRSSENTVTDGR